MNAPLATPRHLLVYLILGAPRDGDAHVWSDFVCAELLSVLGLRLHGGARTTAERGDVATAAYARVTTPETLHLHSPDNQTPKAWKGSAQLHP